MKPNYDVIVAGGGPAGIGAAVGAGRLGARVALVERWPMLGGMGTAGLVSNFCPAHFVNNRTRVDGTPVIGGVFGELRRRLREKKALYVFDEIHGRKLVIEPFNPEAYAAETRALCEEAGVELLLGRAVAGVVMNSGRIAELRLSDGSSLSAGAVVDATGDAWVSRWAGVECRLGRERDGAVMPLTFCYLISGINLDEVRRAAPQFVFRDAGEEFHYLSGWYPEIDPLIAQARAAGELSIPRDHISSIIGVPGRRGWAMINFGRVFCADPTDAAQLAEAEVEGKKQVEEGIRFFRKHLRGFANIRLEQLARQIGVRESWRIRGRYTLTGDEVRTGTQFADVIAQCCYPVDIHDPGKDTSTLLDIEGGGHYDIPWRCLLPAAGAENLVAAGRIISATHEAMGSFRVAPSIIAIGEAAGVTAALAGGGAVAQVGAAAVQQRLLATGGILL